MKLVRILCKFVRFRIDSGRCRIEGIFLLEQNKKRKKKEKRGFVVTGWRRWERERAEWSRVGRTWNRINARDYAPVSDVYLVCGFPARERYGANTRGGQHRNNSLACERARCVRPVTAHKRRRRARKRPTLPILSFDALVNSNEKGELPPFSRSFSWLERNRMIRDEEWGKTEAKCETSAG